MNQVIHIFRKDVRRHSPEIAVSLGLLALFAWNEPKNWVPHLFEDSPLRAMLNDKLGALIAISWLLLILRVVHAESLVGDRQFWVTRPYEWKQLLAAKTLFVLTFINVPLLIVQLFLLWKAGFAPAHYLSGLLWIQLLWLGVLVLPMATLATVTSSFGQTVLVILGLLLLSIFIAVVNSEVTFPEVALVRRIPEWLPTAVLMATFVAVLLWQYWRRQTNQSRLLLVGIPVTLSFVTSVRPPDPFPIRDYPQLIGQQLPVQISFDNTKSPATDGYHQKDKVGIQIPLLLSGIKGDHGVEIQATKLNIDETGGIHWSSGWIRSPQFILPEMKKTQILFSIDKAAFEKLKAASARVQISFALANVGGRDTRTLVAGTGGFAVPGDALCWPDLGNPNVECRAPLKTPSLIASTISNQSTCVPRESEKAPAGTIFHALVDPSSVGIEISPVRRFRMSFLFGSDREIFARVCPGTPLTVSIREEEGRSLSELTLDEIHLADYQLIDPRERATGVAIGLH